MKKINLNKTEMKILYLALNDDDRVQNHYSQKVFNCHYLADYVSKLRVKLSRYFKVDGFDVIKTETYQVTKIDGTVTPIGIYRIEPKYKIEIKKILDTYSKLENLKSAKNGQSARDDKS